MDLDIVYEGDCVDVMKGFPDKCVDLIFADPPYNLTVGRRALRRADGSEYRREISDWDKFSSNEEYDHFAWRWLTQARRVLRDDGAIWVTGTYHNIFRIGTMLMDLKWFILNDILWIKSNPTPNFSGTRFCSAHETLIWAIKKKGAGNTFNYQMMKDLNGGKKMRSDWALKACTGPERLKTAEGKSAHPAQKLEELLERVILATTHEGDIILDPFFGTGTTGAVADRLDRYWVGIDNNAEYVDLAIDRITRQREAENE